MNAVGFQNTLQYGDCNGKPGPAVSEDSFFIGVRNSGRMKELRREMLVETLRRRGLNDLASCWAGMPLSYFESL